MDLGGRLFVVAGGAGVAGEAVTLALLGHGATVAVPSRSPQRLTRLREVADSPRLHGYVGDVSDPGEAAVVRDRIVADLGPIDGVVASLGGWWEGQPLTEIPMATWERILRDNLISHFVVARTFLPALASRPGTVYLTLGGIAARQPVAGSGPISMTGAAQAMMMRVLAVELAGSPVRLHEVDILTPIVTRHWDGGPIEPGCLTGEQVGEYVVRVLSGDVEKPDQLFFAIPAG